MEENKTPEITISDSDTSKEEKKNEYIMHSKVELRTFLYKLPDEKERKFEKDIVTICMVENQNKDLPKWAEDLAKNDSYDKVAFAAFCVLCNIARRTCNRSDERKLISVYEGKFRHHVFFNHLKLLSLLDDDFIKSDYDRIVNLAYENTKNIPENAGIQHALADTVATLFEDAEFDVEKDMGIEWRTKWLKIGMEAVEKAILIESTYAKFYCTKARLLSLSGNHRDALIFINKAIDDEESNKADYALRIGNYRMHLQKINNRHLNELTKSQIQAEMEKQQKVFIDEVNKSKNKSIEFIGLFAGIISFTIGGIDIALALEDFSVVSIAGLLVVLMGALLGVYAGFGVILHGFEKKESIRNYIVFAMGLILIAGGIFLCWL